jgi:hypothetical protein
MREGRIIRTPEEEQELSKEFRWPGIVVNSWQFGNLPVDERLRQLALGYLQSAKILCLGLGECPHELTWPRAAVVCFCFQHAVELFLKSCILHQTGEIQKCSHDIASLRKQYFDLYPDRAFFFQTPWSLSMDDIEEAFGGRPDLEDFEEKQDQVYRYLSDKKGRSPKRVYYFGLGAWLWLIERLEDDINRIWENIRELDSKV